MIAQSPGQTTIVCQTFETCMSSKMFYRLAKLLHTVCQPFLLGSSKNKNKTGMKIKIVKQENAFEFFKNIAKEIWLVKKCFMTWPNIQTLFDNPIANVSQTIFDHLARA